MLVVHKEILKQFFAWRFCSKIQDVGIIMLMGGWGHVTSFEIDCVCSIYCVGPHHHHVPTFTGFTVWIQFTVLVPTSTMYLHSLCSLCGFISLHGSSPPTFTAFTSLWLLSLSPLHPIVSSVSTTLAQFNVWIPTTTLYLHSLHLLHPLHSLCGFNPQSGSPQPHCTCIHCVHDILHGERFAPFALKAMSPPPYTYIFTAHCVGVYDLFALRTLSPLPNTSYHCILCTA